MVQNDKKDTVKLVVKKLQTQPKKPQKSRFCRRRELNPLTQQKKRAAKSPEVPKRNSKDFGDSDVENILRNIGFSINRYLEVGKERDLVLKKLI